MHSWSIENQCLPRSHPDRASINPSPPSIAIPSLLSYVRSQLSFRFELILVSILNNTDFCGMLLFNISQPIIWFPLHVPLSLFIISSWWHYETLKYRKTVCVISLYDTQTDKGRKAYGCALTTRCLFCQSHIPQSPLCDLLPTLPGSPLRGLPTLFFIIL